MRPSITVTIALLGTVAAAAIVASVASRDANVPSDSAMPTLVGASAAMRFTDEHGNPRQPTAEERAQLGAAFQADLAALTRNKRIPSGSKREPDGTVSAVVAPHKLQYLVVSVDDDGSVSFGHARADDEGHVDTRPDNNPPEM